MKANNLKFAVSKAIKKMPKEDIVSDYPMMTPERKKIILGYMKSFSIDIVGSENVFDVIKKEYLSYGNGGYFDGTYIWDDSMIYHLEKYNLRLTDEFIDHVLKKAEGNNDATPSR